MLPNDQFLESEHSFAPPRTRVCFVAENLDEILSILPHDVFHSLFHLSLFGHFRRYAPLMNEEHKKKKRLIYWQCYEN
jgi:hypothetical protein